MKKIVVASDSFKGTFSSLQVARMVREVLDPQLYHVDAVGISDGGEGFCRVLTDALHGRYVSVSVHDPLMRPMQACYGVSGETAIIDVATASGLTLLKPEERDPWHASSYGTGELIRDALSRGYRHLLIGLGGSATSDCGRGMLEALEGWDDEITATTFTVASDVTNPLCGPNGAAYVYGGQKGADEQMKARLDERARAYGKELERRCGHAVIDLPGAGAAGGIGAALLSLPHTVVRRGIDVVLDAQHFDHRIADVAAVITGEGCIDCQTLCGKAPYGIALRARQQGIPCLALYGRLELTEDELASAPWTATAPISDFVTKLDETVGTIRENS